MRDALLGTGHWERREFNPMDGVPDVSYCTDGVEGHIELKHHPSFPARPTTAVFGARTARGMRDTQVAWFRRRLSAGGRAYILAGVGSDLYLFGGWLAAEFNTLTLPEFDAHALWSVHRQASAQDWQRLLVVLTGKFAGEGEGERQRGSRGTRRGKPAR
jgi:hypothetical protein